MLRLQPSTISLTSSDIDTFERRLLAKQRRQLAVIHRSRAQLNPSPAHDTAGSTKSIEDNPALQGTASSGSEASFHTGQEHHPHSLPISFSESVHREGTLGLPERPSKLLHIQTHLLKSEDIGKVECDDRNRGSVNAPVYFGTQHRRQWETHHLRHHKSRSLDDHLGRQGTFQPLSTFSEGICPDVESRHGSPWRVRVQQMLRNPALDPQASMFVPSSPQVAATGIGRANVVSHQDSEPPTFTRATTPSLQSLRRIGNKSLPVTEAALSRLAQENPHRAHRADDGNKNEPAPQQKSLTYQQAYRTAQSHMSQSLPTTDRYRFLQNSTQSWRAEPHRVNVRHRDSFPTSPLHSDQSGCEICAKRRAGVDSITSGFSAMSFHDHQPNQDAASESMTAAHSPLDRSTDGLNHMNLAYDKSPFSTAPSTTRTMKPLFSSDFSDQESPQRPALPQNEFDFHKINLRNSMAQPLSIADESENPVPSPPRDLVTSSSLIVPSSMPLRSRNGTASSKQHLEDPQISPPSFTMGTHTPSTALRSGRSIAVYTGSFESVSPLHRSDATSNTPIITSQNLCREFTSSDPQTSQRPQSSQAEDAVPASMPHTQPQLSGVVEDSNAPPASRPYSWTLRPTGRTMRPREEEEENGLAARYSGLQSQMEEHRARWLSRRSEPGSLDTTPPAEGRFERYMD